MLPNRNRSKNSADGSSKFVCDEHIWNDQATRCHFLEDCRLCEKSNFEGSNIGPRQTVLNHCHFNVFFFLGGGVGGSSASINMSCVMELEFLPLSYGVPVRERYGSTLLPATREQHDQNCTQSH